MIILDDIKYKVLFTYENNNKKYIIYTENKEDENGFIKTFSGILENKEGKDYILPIKDDIEIEMINSILETLTKEE